MIHFQENNIFRITFQLTAFAEKNEVFLPLLLQHSSEIISYRRRETYDESQMILLHKIYCHFEEPKLIWEVRHILVKYTYSLILSA